MSRKHRRVRKGKSIRSYYADAYALKNWHGVLVNLCYMNNYYDHWSVLIYLSAYGYFFAFLNSFCTSYFHHFVGIPFRTLRIAIRSHCLPRSKLRIQGGATVRSPRYETCDTQNLDICAHKVMSTARLGGDMTHIVMTQMHGISKVSNKDRVESDADVLSQL